MVAFTFDKHDMDPVAALHQFYTLWLNHAKHGHLLSVPLYTTEKFHSLLKGLKNMSVVNGVMGIGGCSFI